MTGENNENTLRETMNEIVAETVTVNETDTDVQIDIQGQEEC